jgi:hypothetical protein
MGSIGAHNNGLIAMLGGAHRCCRSYGRFAHTTLSGEEENSAHIISFLGRYYLSVCLS